LYKRHFEFPFPFRLSFQVLSHFVDIPSGGVNYFVEIILLRGASRR
jgi:hypothetical protein